MYHKQTFQDRAGHFSMPGLRVTAPFFLRRMRVSLRPRSGAATAVPFDPAPWGPPGPPMRAALILWIGHSTFLVRMDGATFLTDPMFSYRASPFRFMGPRRMVPPGTPLDALPKLDFVLLSHDHYDHTDIATVRWLARREVPFIVPLGMREWIERAGGQAAELDWWQETERSGVRVTCVPAQHFSGRTLRDRFRRLWCGWVIAGPTRRFYYAGDSAYFPGFNEIGERLGPFDLAAIPIGAYLPAEMMHPVHVTPEEALRIAKDVNARRTVAMHFGTFDLSDEPPDEPPRRFRAEAERLGWGADRAWVMNVGETREW